MFGSSDGMNKSDRNYNLDILRIMAAAFVFLVHLGQWSGYPRNAENGFYGVWLFFILSGYLIFESLDKYEQLNWNNVKDYYKKRIVRIIPLYWSILIFIWVFDLLKYVVLEGMPLSCVIAKDGVCGIKFLRYFFFGQMFIPSDNYDLWNNRYVLWTMSAFALFYLLAPIIKKLSDSFLKSLVVLFIFYEINKYIPNVLRSVFSGAYGDALESFPELNALCVMYLFFIGVCAYYAIKEKKTVLYAVILIIGYSFYIFRGTEYEIVFVLFLMVATSTNMEIKNEKVKTAILLMSKCSFPLYLTHIIWFDIVTRICSFIGTGVAIRLLLYVIGAMAVAYVTERIITPIENIIRNMIL